MLCIFGIIIFFFEVLKTFFLNVSISQQCLEWARHGKNKSCMVMIQNAEGIFLKFLIPTNIYKTTVVSNLEKI
jgi:hypothetical protein